ncbi:sensor histidine kinase [Saccharothrix xinjiangensis]|uniref:histidine kinase n=1 Tax=Saccharothrix xinjiangensis TaxID=204798 RepID=A0ABV9Y451_9PSEU
MTWRWVVPRPVAVDLVLAVSAGLVDACLFSALVGHWTGDVRDWSAAAFLVTGSAALLLRRRWPVAVFAFAWVEGVLAAPISGVDVRLAATSAVALFTVAFTRSGRASTGAMIACAVLALLAGLQEAATHPPGERAVAMPATTLFYLLLYGCVWAFGRWTRVSRRLAAREAVLAERGRIARELHDIVAHSVTVMVLQAAGARRVLATDQARVGKALGHIEEAGEQAMGELRRMLTALRLSYHDDPPPPDGVTGRPQPGLADLDRLVRAVSAAGVRVRTRVEGSPRRLAASVDLAAYRVAQEALTNVTKHVGPGATVEVRLTWGDADLTVTVVDDGRGRPPDRVLSTHNGLTGLRERLEIVGGRLAADPRPEGGFRLTAVLPAPAPQPERVPERVEEVG